MAVAYNKLVRDNIPEIIKQEGFTPVTKILKSSEYKSGLEKKLCEEVGEVIHADDSESRCGELADVLEIIEELALLEGKSLADIKDYAEKKKRRNGGFSKRIFLIEKY